MKMPANPKLTAMMLNLISGSTPRIFTSEAAKEKTEPGENDRVVTPVNNYLLLPTDESLTYTLYHNSIEKHVIFSENSIPANENANYRAVFIITKGESLKTTVTTALFYAEALAINCDNCKGDGIHVLGENADLVTNLKCHPVYTQKTNPETQQMQTFVQYYDFSTLGLSISEQGITIKLKTPPPPTSSAP